MNKSLLIGIVLVAVIGVIAVIFLSQNKNTDKNTSMATSSDIKEEVMEEKSDKMMAEDSRYVDFTAQKFEEAKDKKRVYFFHASWCPTCKVVNKEFSENSTGIPEDVMIFKTDYDTENELKKKYNITYQHTFVFVDENGSEIKKWNGGGLAELVQNTQ